MEIEKCLEFQQILNRELRPFAVPILIAPNLNLCPSEIRNATGILLNLGARQCLVTCYHVWKYLQHRNGENNPGVMVALLNDGYGAFHIKHPTLLTRDDTLRLADELDLAVIDVTGVQDYGEKKCFPFDDATIHNAVQDDILVTIGFPGMWRKSDMNFSRVSSGPLPFVITDVTKRLLIVSEANQFNREVFEYLDAEPRGPDSGDSCGGLSGAPAFYVSQKPFKIAGFVRERALGSLNLTRASTITTLIQ